nr:MAG TPA: hypothetical protein [Caudoviricetes sp.]
MCTHPCCDDIPFLVTSNTTKLGLYKFKKQNLITRHRTSYTHPHLYC